MNKENLIKLGKKIFALAEHGIDGEKESAKKMLDIFMSKNNLSIDDLLGEPLINVSFRISAPQRQFFYQVVGSVTGNHKEKNSYEDRGRIYLKLTQQQYVEVKDKFLHYWPIYEKDLDIFYSAFIQKNHLYRKPEEDFKPREFEEMTPEEQEYIRKMLSMMEGLTHNTHLKKIENK